MITVNPLGVGGAFTKKYYHNNYIFKLDDRKLLVDAGTTLRYSLNDSTYDVNDITDILITHLHSDHVGGLEEFGQQCKFVYNHKPNLWVREDMKQELYDVIGKGLETDGFKIEDYFNICLFNVVEGFNIHDYRITTIKTDGLHAKNMKSFGFKVIPPYGHSLLFTSDIANIEAARLDDYIDDNTKVFHDCSIIENPVHSSFDQIIKYYGEHEVKSKFYLMHYQDDVDVDEMRRKGFSFVRQDMGYII